MEPRTQEQASSGDDAFHSSSPYRTLGPLARGGMGEVELVMRTQGTFRRCYAMKRLRPEHREDPAFRKMFVDEARVAGLIRHSNVVSVLDVGEDERGPYLVMDFVEGINGADLARWSQRNDQWLPVQLVARIIRQTAAGISAAHELVDDQGQPLHVIHRDITPQNVLLGYDGVVRVTDFGIAKALGRVTQTTQGVLKGKAGYMAPEQLRFERPKQPADFFALGVVFYELLSGTRLYGGKDAIEVAQRVLTEPPPDIYSVREDVHPALVELLFDLLAKQPAERPDSAADIVARLDRVIDELVAEEGAIRLETFLGEHFGKERDADRQRRAALLEQPPEPSALYRVEPSEVDAPTEVGAPSELATPPTRSRYRVLAAALALGLVGAIALATRGDSPPPAPAESTNVANAPEIPEPPSPVPAIVPAPAEPDPAEAMAADEGEPAAEEGDAPRRRATMRRRGRRPVRDVPMNRPSAMIVAF